MANNIELSSASSCCSLAYIRFLYWMMITGCHAVWRIKKWELVCIEVILVCIQLLLFFFGAIFGLFSFSLKLIILNVMCRTLYKSTSECKHGETAAWLSVSRGSCHWSFSFSYTSYWMCLYGYCWNLWFLTPPIKSHIKHFVYFLSDQMSLNLRSIKS